MDKFTLEIEFGDDAMQTPRDLAWTLRQLADGFDTWDAWPSLIEEGIARDLNGNTVGRWEAS